MNIGKLAPVALSVGLLGIVGGVAGAQMLSHSTVGPAQVRMVQPAAQTLTPSPTTTTATPTPVKVVKAVVAPAPVHSTQAVAPAPAPIKKAAPLSVQPAAPAPQPAAPAPAETTGVSTQATPGQVLPPVIPANPGPVPSNQTHS